MRGHTTKPRFPSQGEAARSAKTASDLWSPDQQLDRCQYAPFTLRCLALARGDLRSENGVQFVYSLFVRVECR